MASEPESLFHTREYIRIMKLSSYLDSHFIFSNLSAETKEDAIRQLIQKTAKADEAFNRQKQQIEELVLEREQSISTAMGNGFAVPHARVDGYDDVIVAVGILSREISCELATKEPGTLRMLFLIVAQKTKNQLILQLMAGISRLTENRELFDKICRETDPDIIYSDIKKARIQLKAEITAEDIMETTIAPARLDNTLGEIAKRLVVENLVGLPVVDEGGRFLGEITERELIQFGLPKYASVLKNVSFMTSSEPFENYFQHEHSVSVKELYRANPITIDKSASIMEISFIMVNKGNTRIYVVEEGRYLGMIVRSDIIKKVLHI